MPNVVVVAGLAFPPSANANVHRVLGWARHLPQFGWHVTVLSLPLAYRPPSEQDATLLENIPPETDVRRIPPLIFTRLPRSKDPFGFGVSGAGSGSRSSLSLWAMIATIKRNVIFPDTRILWVPVAVREICSIGRQRSVDVVLTTSRENSSHIAGWLASRLCRVPWVADFQDPWESPWIKLANRIQARASRWSGRRILQAADAVTAMSWNTRELLAQLCPKVGSKIHVITNGFEPGKHPGSIAIAKRDAPFTIVHTGKLYGNRRVAPLLEAIDQACEQNSRLASELEVRLIGDVDQASAADIAPYRGRQWLRLISSVPHAEARRHQAEATVLLLVPGEESQSLPSKIFEYLSTGRPILALCSSDTDTARLLQEVGTGTVVASDDVPGLTRLIREWTAHPERLRDVAPGSSGGLTAFTWDSVVGQMASVLDRVVSTSG